MNNEQIRISQFLQVKFSKYINRHTVNLKKPSIRFMKEMTNGIIKSQSCIVRQIAQNLSESISLKKTQERLTYQLDNDKEIEKIRENMLMQSSRKLNKDSLIIIDPSDIIKPAANKMEGLANVRDGNDGKYKPGYDVIDIIGINQSQSKTSIYPIHSELHSEKIGLDTFKSKIFDRVLDIIIHSNNSGIFVMDRGFDDKKVIQELYKHNASFIIRMKKNRHVFYKGDLLNISKVADRISKRHKIKIDCKRTIRAGISEISIPLSRHKVKDPEKAKVYLVSAKITSKKSNDRNFTGKFMILISIPGSKKTSKEMCELALKSYRLRWKIEEVHRQIKTDFGWEKIQLLKFDRLQALNTLFWLALGFIYDLDDWKYKFAKAFNNLMLDKKNDLKILNKFIYYRITKVIRHCFLMFNIYKKIRKYGRKKNDLQILLQLD